MADKPDSFSCQHFSLANAAPGGDATSLPVLLRRVADRIEERDIKPMEILDVTVSSEVTGDGPWWSVTVYWSPAEPQILPDDGPVVGLPSGPGRDS